MRVAAIVPAWNEEETVGAVVAAARRAALVDEVVVVDNRSTDATAAVAAAAGARVVHEPVPGKGEAMRTGVAATEAEIVVFLDADLLGLQAGHVDALVAAVRNGAGMACGLFDRGPTMNVVFRHALPILTGQRAMRRELFERLTSEDLKGYRVEASLNSLAKDLGLPVEAWVCAGLWHRTKEEKFESPARGFLAKQAMLLTAAGAYVSFRLRRAGVTTANAG